MNYRQIILLIIITALNLFSSIKAQDLNFHIIGMEGPVVLYELSGENRLELDSIHSYDNGKYNLSNVLGRMYTGFYRLKFPDNQQLNFIYDGKDIEIIADSSDIPGSMEVIKSNSNRLYYDFIKLGKSYKTKTEMLQFILARYPKDDKYYEITENRLHEIQTEYLQFVRETSQTEPKSFAARYIRSAQLPVISSGVSFDKQLDYLKSHALEFVDFNDSGLIYSDLFTSKSIEYLTYYRNPQLPKGLLEKEFMTAVDTLLDNAKVNPLVYQHITDYLIDGFKKFGFDTVIDYIVENYVIVDDLCLDEETENSIQRRIDQAKLLNIASIVPNIVLPDRFGNKIDLKEIKSEKILILFYASWCDHCMQLLPKLNELYKDRNQFKIYAVSLDENREEWIDLIEAHNLDWINVSDLKGWDSEAASDFHIYATPTMFLVNQEKQIIAKPLTLRELELAL